MSLLGLTVSLCGSGLNNNSGITRTNINSSHLHATTSMLGIILSTLHISAIEFSGRLYKVNAPIIPQFTDEETKPQEHTASTGWSQDLTQQPGFGIPVLIHYASWPRCLPFPFHTLSACHGILELKGLAENIV